MAQKYTLKNLHEFFIGSYPHPSKQEAPKSEVSKNVGLEAMAETISDKEMERWHDYIQWWFPTHKASDFNKSAYYFNLEENNQKNILAFYNDPRVHTALLKATQRFLEFCGYQLDYKLDYKLESDIDYILNDNFDLKTDYSPDITQFTLKKAENFEERKKHLQNNFHNSLRLTRIIECLGLLGHKDLAKNLSEQIIEDDIYSKSIQFHKNAAETLVSLSELIEQKKQTKQNATQEKPSPSIFTVRRLIQGLVYATIIGAIIDSLLHVATGGKFSLYAWARANKSNKVAVSSGMTGDRPDEPSAELRPGASQTTQYEQSTQGQTNQSTIETRPQSPTLT